MTQRIMQSLNPFFIRSQGRTLIENMCDRFIVLIPSSSGLKVGHRKIGNPGRARGLNPFFIRSQGRTARSGDNCHRRNVLIPSSSGLKVGHRHGGLWRNSLVLIPSSSGLKVGRSEPISYYRNSRLNPFFIRSQGRTSLIENMCDRFIVLIPSSSGLKVGLVSSELVPGRKVLIPSSSGLKVGQDSSNMGKRTTS